MLQEEEVLDAKGCCCEIGMYHVHDRIEWDVASSNVVQPCHLIKHAYYQSRGAFILQFAANLSHVE